MFGHSPLESISTGTFRQFICTLWKLNFYTKIISLGFLEQRILLWMPNPANACQCNPIFSARTHPPNFAQANPAPPCHRERFRWVQLQCGRKIGHLRGHQRQRTSITGRRQYKIKRQPKTLPHWISWTWDWYSSPPTSRPLCGRTHRRIRWIHRLKRKLRFHQWPTNRVVSGQSRFDIADNYAATNNAVLDRDKHPLTNG